MYKALSSLSSNLYLQSEPLHMHDATKTTKRNRVNLADYDFESDIANRILLSTFTEKDFIVLEEILYSPIHFTIEKLALNLDFTTEVVLETIEKLAETKLLSFEKNSLTVNKEKRKYFETQIEKFEDDFFPGMEFLQNLLKRPPIDLLPIWYHIPRSSNNIFESLIEKYLQTPQIFQRYLLEFMTGEDLISLVLMKVYESPSLTVSFSDLMEMFNLSHQELTEIAIYLEFSLVAVTRYIKQDNQWTEVLSPFKEWYNYQMFLTGCTPSPVKNIDQIEIYRESEYAFVEDMKKILLLAQSNPLEVSFDRSLDQYVILQKSAPIVIAQLKLTSPNTSYINRLINKLFILGLAKAENTLFKPTPPSEDWMATPTEQRAHITFKHPHNFVAMQKNSPLTTPRSILEIEKSMSTISKLGWVYFDEFIKGSQIVLNDEQKIILKPTGREWQYAIPSYTKEEETFIRAIVLEWLFEGGIVQTGIHNGKDTLRLTPLGESLFKT